MLGLYEKWFWSIFGLFIVGVIVLICVSYNNSKHFKEMCRAAAGVPLYADRGSEICIKSDVIIVVK